MPSTKCKFALRAARTAVEAQKLNASLFTELPLVSAGFPFLSAAMNMIHTLAGKARLSVHLLVAT